MLSWSKKRQIFFLGGVLLVVFLLVGFPAIITLYDGPSCSNGKQDKKENGVDCGGACRLLCQGEVLAPLVHFTRPVQVDEGLWGAVAYLENKNIALSRSAPYRFRLYDSNNLLLYERYGQTYIPPRKIFAIFEGRMETGGRVPSRAVFEFESAPRFESAGEEPILEVRNKRFQVVEGVSRLEAELINRTLSSYEGVYLTALLFDEEGNVVRASATNLEHISAKGKANLFFTWPGIIKDPARIEILYTFPLSE